MAQSLSRVLVHLVFGTKDRVPWILREIRSELHAYLGGIIRNHGCWPMEIGGVEDHVHVLLGLARTVSAAEIVSSLKANSSKWIKGKRRGCGKISMAGRICGFLRRPFEFGCPG